jgi:hypothetical protein
MKKQPYLILAAACVASWPTPCRGIGDRNANTDITFPATLLLQNGGPVIDVKHPPMEGMHVAAGDGVTDDTAAFQDVYDLLKKKYETSGWSMETLFVYIPNGTYLLSDSILYRGAACRWRQQFDICSVNFIGQSRAKTILRLADHAPLFQDKRYPRPVISFQHPDTKFNNSPGSSRLRNLTIDTGNGNPGAVGVFFQGANQTDIHNVTIMSEDGSGLYGLWFKIGSVQGYYSDITIRGFDYGLYDTVNAEGNAAFEYLTLERQNLAGVYLSGGGLSLRECSSTQSDHGVTSLKIDGSGPHAVIIDSVLDGGNSRESAIELTKDQQQCLFARNVTVKGYETSVTRNGTIVVQGVSIDEYVSSPAKTLFAAQNGKSLSLPIMPTPQVPWYDPATQWALVDDYPGIQAAMDSGKPVVCFKKHSYRLPGDIHVPSSVRFIDLLGAELNQGTLVVSDSTPNPLLIQDGKAAVRIDANRDVIERCTSRGIGNPQGIPVTLFLENVNDCATGDNFCRAGQKIFARQIDVEYRNAPQIVVNGGSMWVFGFKTEDSGSAAPFVVKNGGSLEVLGGYVNMCTGLGAPGTQSPMITNDNSNLSITCFTNMTHLFDVVVRETRHNTAREALSAEFPLRGGPYTKNFVVPLYVGRMDEQPH